MRRCSGFAPLRGPLTLAVDLGVILSCGQNTVHRVDVPTNRVHRAASAVEATADAPAPAPAPTPPPISGPRMAQRPGIDGLPEPSRTVN
jgi:hypothetical protein